MSSRSYWLSLNRSYWLSLKKIKIEVAKRNLSLRKLFGEMWGLYKTKKIA